MASFRQTCDSFFAESYDDAGRIQRARALEQTKYFKQERQMAIAEQLSELAKAEYQEDLLSHMEQMEVRRYDFLLRLSHANQCIVGYLTRRRFYRYSNRDPVVHASIST